MAGRFTAVAKCMNGLGCRLTLSEVLRIVAEHALHTKDSLFSLVDGV